MENVVFAEGYSTTFRKICKFGQEINYNNISFLYLDTVAFVPVVSSQCKLPEFESLLEEGQHEKAESARAAWLQQCALACEYAVQREHKEIKLVLFPVFDINPRGYFADLVGIPGGVNCIVSDTNGAFSFSYKFRVKKLSYRELNLTRDLALSDDEARPFGSGIYSARRFLYPTWHN